MFVRPCFDVLMERMREPRQFIQVVVGPRQVGKSTLVKQALQQIDIPYTFELADGIPEDDTSWIGRVWESARAQYRILGGGEYLLVIDEIQKMQNWSEAVKREWDGFVQLWLQWNVERKSGFELQQKEMEPSFQL